MNDEGHIDDDSDLHPEGQFGANDPEVADVERAEKLAGLSFEDWERWLLLPRAREQLAGYAVARKTELPNSLEPALRFDPRPPAQARMPVRPPPPPPAENESRPAQVDPEELPFLPIAQLARLLRTGQVTSLELTRLALDRLRRYGPGLRCLVTPTEGLALEQAQRADRELAAGEDRGALHGVPYGLKDLLAVPGYPVSWGAAPFREQRFDEPATVVERLEQAGAVLVAKLSLGELAMGDVWFGGMTRSPWERYRGASGSSAGSASAVAAGLVPFAIGSETMGSIVSPATRCGVVGLRPSVGLVSRHGAMALAWSLDKLGPLARSAEDCALVLQAIAGPDGKDASVLAAGFEWEANQDSKRLRVGYVREAFEADSRQGRLALALLETLRARGLEPIPLELPEFAPEPIMTALMVEAAAAFDQLTRSDLDDELAQQGQGSWPNLLRAARLVPAVEYLQAQRLRTLAVQQMRDLMSGVDVYLCPSWHHPNLYLTNATGNPTVCIPAGFDGHGRPLDWSMTITGRLYGEQEALTLASEVEEVVGKRPLPDSSTWATAAGG